MMVHEKYARHWPCFFGACGGRRVATKPPIGGGGGAPPDADADGLDDVATVAQEKTAVDDAKPAAEAAPPAAAPPGGALAAAKAWFINFDMVTWFRETYAPALFKYRHFVVGGFVALWAVFLVFACMVTPSPFLIYTLFPTGTNVYDYFESLFNEARASRFHFCLLSHKEFPPLREFTLQDISVFPPSHAACSENGRRRVDRERAAVSRNHSVRVCVTTPRPSPPSSPRARRRSTRRSSSGSRPRRRSTMAG
jgi:hypothetical protein